MTGQDSQDQLTQADFERLAAFRHLLREFLGFSEAAALAAGVQPQQHQALLAIKGVKDGGRLSIGGLAEQLCIRHHSAVGLVDRLAARGLVRREADHADRRQVMLALTEAADQILADLSRAHRDELRRLAPLLRGLLASFDP